MAKIRTGDYVQLSDGRTGNVKGQIGDVSIVAPDCDNVFATILEVTADLKKIPRPTTTKETI